MTGFSLLPPRPDVCQECAVDHAADQPHNAQSLFYLAGWFDGEGSFVMKCYLVKGRPQTQVRASAANTHKATLEMLCGVFGGKVAETPSKNRRLWVWALHGFANVLHFCETIGPCLFEKRQEAEVVALYCCRRLGAKRRPLVDADLAFVSWLDHVRSYRQHYAPGGGLYASVLEAVAE